MRRTRRRRPPVIPALVVAVLVVAVLVVAVLLLGGTDRTPHPGRRSDRPIPTRQIRGSVRSADAVDLTPTCGSPDPQGTLGPAVAIAAHATRTLTAPTGGIVDFAAGPAGIWTETSTQLQRATLSGRRVLTIPLPSSLRTTTLNSSSLVVDARGDVTVAGYLSGQVDHWSAQGRLEWTSRAVAHPAGLFTLGSAADPTIAVSRFPGAGSTLLDPAGRPVGTVPVSASASSYVTEVAGGDLLVSTDGHVQRWAANGRRMLGEFGGQATEGHGVHTGGPYQSYLPGQAVEGPGGAVWTADPTSTIESTSAGGVLRATTDLDGQLALASGQLYEVGGNLYYESGTIFTPHTTVASVPVATVAGALAAPHPALDTLGWGAGLDTAAPGNYFAPSTRPEVSADLDSWWAARATHTVLRYSVWDAADLAVRRPPSRTVALPRSATALRHITLPLPSADTVPGPYAVEASLWDTATAAGTLLGSTCLPYTVGAPGDRLDLTSLPSGLGPGGPADPRGVALDDQLGLDGTRALSTVDWTDFLPDCDASALTAAACGPAAMTFSDAPVDWYRAADRARADHIRYWVEISGGDPTSLALARQGWWGDDVAALVAHYAQVPPGCVRCAPVGAWEAWNEPNNTGWSSGAAYVRSVLAPFDRAVHDAEPGSTVIGGSTLGIPLPWWRSLVAAGGLHDMDVAAVHPYPPDNDSFDEAGTVGALRALRSLIGTIPLWFTELGWWSDGDYDATAQADNLAQTRIWMRALHVPVLNYYYPEGGAGAGGVSFSLIQTGDRGDDYVKAAALASMTSTTLLANRPFVAMLDTGIPHTYAAAFGPGPGRSDRMVALWSDGLATTARIRVTRSPADGSNLDGSTAAGSGAGQLHLGMVDEYGAPTGATVRSGASYGLDLDSTVRYLMVPAGDSVSIGAPARYGPDRASGATARASSGSAAAAFTGSVTGPGWTSSSGNVEPSLTAVLPAAVEVDRVIVDTQSAGSTATGLRDYTVAVRRPGGHWSTVASVTGALREHEQQSTFAPVDADAVRITVSAIDFGGYAGGGIPWFWPASQTGAAFVHDVEVYGGTEPPRVASGAGLPPLR